MTVIRSATESTVCHQNGGETWLDEAMKLDNHQWQRKGKHSNRSLNRSKKISCSYPKIVKQEEGKAKLTSNLSKETENYRSIARWTLKSNGKSGKITKSTTGRELRCAYQSIRTQGHSAKAACEKSEENRPPSRFPGSLRRRRKHFRRVFRWRRQSIFCSRSAFRGENPYETLATQATVATVISLPFYHSVHSSFSTFNL